MAKKRAPVLRPADLSTAEYSRLNRQIREGLLPVQPRGEGVPRDFSDLTPQLLEAANVVSMMKRYITPTVREANNCQELGDVVRRLAAGGELTIGPCVVRIATIPKGRRSK